MAPMKSKSWCSPGQLLMLMLAGWINRHQQAVIAYQKEEIEVLREMLGGKRLRFTDAQRRHLALKVRALSPQSARIKVLAMRLSSRPTITLQMARWSGGSDSVACSTITTEKPHEIGTIQ